jgi:hypothetical protein
VAIDGVIERKLDALDALESQFYEGGALGSADLIPKEPEKQTDRRRQIRAGHAARSQAWAERFRGKLADWYGPEKAGQVRHAEAFEVCEYGRQPTRAELARLFPFFAE